MHVVSTLEPLVVTVQSVLPVGIWTALDRVSERSTSSVDSSDRLTDGSSCSLGEGMPIDRLNFQLSESGGIPQLPLNGVFVGAVFGKPSYIRRYIVLERKKPAIG